MEEKMKKNQKKFINDYTSAGVHLFELPVRDAGFLFFCLSLPESFAITISGLASMLPEGDSALRASLNSLVSGGYLTRKAGRSENGRRFVQYSLTEKSRDKSSGCILLDNRVVRDRNLTLTAKCVWARVKSDTQKSFSLGVLAGLCRCGMYAVQKAVSALEDAGFLRRTPCREEGRFSGMKYEIPAEMFQPDPGRPIFQEARKAGTGKKNFQEARKAGAGKKNEILGIPAGLPLKGVTKACSRITFENPATVKRTLINNYIRKLIDNARARAKQASVFWNQNCRNGQNEISDVKETVKANLDYSVMVRSYGERLDGVVGLIAGACMSQKASIRIAGTDMPKEAVKARLMSLRSDHVQYVFECLDRQTAVIHNPAAYILTCLYNAPDTICEYYRALARRNVPSCRPRPNWAGTKKRSAWVPHKEIDRHKYDYVYLN
jgi:DNA-binding MarR family transcriptional regulator